MVLFRYFFLYAIFLSFVVSCQSVNDVSANQFKCYNFEPGWQKDQKVNDVFYDVYVPPKPKDATSCQRVVLVLPGWKFPRTDWPKKSDIIDIANQYQAILVMPEMYTSIYESDYYNETVMKWNEIPGGQFIKEQFLPALQKKGYFLNGYQNWIVGLSTGARGVVMVSLHNPGIFTAGAAFSGDFDQTIEPNDNLVKNIYGTYSQFKDRWSSKDNPVHEIRQANGANWTMPIYISHGNADTVVRWQHSEWLYKVLTDVKGNGFRAEFHLVKGAGHNYKFWSSQLAPAFEFMSK